MEDNSKKIHWRIVAFMLILVLIIAVLSVILIVKLNMQFNDRITNILWGVVTGLSTYIITFIIINKFHYTLNDKILDKVAKLQNDFIPHDDTTNKIFNIVRCKFMTLINYDRQKLLGKGFYEEKFKNSSEIKISGITLKFFLESLTSDTTHTIIEQILNNNNVIVKILLMHPENQIVKILDKQESTSLNSSPVKTKIEALISLLEKFAKKEKDKKLAANSMLEIRLTKETLNVTITYARKKEENKEDVLLMGLLFSHKQGGPLYQIPNDPSFQLYTDCLTNFDMLFENAKKNTIFSWNDSKGKQFTSVLHNTKSSI